MRVINVSEAKTHLSQLLAAVTAGEESASRPDKTDGASIPHVPYRIASKATSRTAPQHIDRAVHYSDNTLAQRRCGARGLYSFKPR